MHPIDIRKYKIELREQCKNMRRELDKDLKSKMDEEIAKRVRKLYQYRSAKYILVYVSTEIEVDTYRIIENAWADGKTVAVPRCIPCTRQMEFHVITSFDDLSPGSFSVLEPSPLLPIVKNFDSALMIVPAFQFDAAGYRLGYGKGYYDRYMSHYNGSSAGICYVENFRRHMYHGRYDRQVDVVVTEKWIRRTNKSRSPLGGGLQGDN